MEGFSFETFVSQYWYYLVVFGVMIVGSIVYNIVYFKKMKKGVANYLEENPDSAKVYLTTKALITSEAVQVHSINNELPANFVEKGKTGFYLKPGDNTAEISYTYTRPGVMYKTVTKSTDVVKKELTVLPNKSYLIGFDRKAEDFTFEEISE